MSSNAPPPNQPLPERVRDAKESLYRETILDVAEETFATEGYAGAKMKECASTARISLATLYGYYPTKMTLYRAVHVRRLDELIPRVRAATRGLILLDAMLAGMREFLRYHMEHTRYLRMHLREGMSWSGSDELLSPEQLAAWSRGQEGAARAFRAGMKSGVFVPDDPELCARRVNALHQVTLAHWIDTGTLLSADELCTQQERRFIRAFCTPELVKQTSPRPESVDA
ncbi:MAG: AcrR family transcriptional regulator [Bradymonadia bacterium]|jgi:AcrR family transcriptional regulator